MPRRLPFRLLAVLVAAAVSFGVAACVPQTPEQQREAEVHRLASELDGIDGVIGGAVQQDSAGTRAVVDLKFDPALDTAGLLSAALAAEAVLANGTLFASYNWNLIVEPEEGTLDRSRLLFPGFRADDADTDAKVEFWAAVTTTIPAADLNLISDGNESMLIELDRGSVNGDTAEEIEAQLMSIWPFDSPPAFAIQ